MQLSVIIPLYNEHNTIKTVIDRLTILRFPDFVEKYEIIIVDDCSQDNSYQIVCEYIKDIEQIKCIKHNVNQGKGAAVRTGIAQSTGDTIIIQDADLELSPNDIPSMLQAMNDLGVEFVNGSRYLPGIARPLSSYKRYLINRFFTFLTSVFINVKLTDMACGYKLFRRNLYNKLHLTENRFGFEAELIIKALRIKKNNVTEVPVNYFPRNEGEGKKLRNSDGFKIFFKILKYSFLK